MTGLKTSIDLAGAKAARAVAGGISGKVHMTDNADLIWALLADPENCLSLSHYDRLMFDLKQPIALLLGEDQCQSTAWKIFAQALSLEGPALEPPSIHRKSDEEKFDRPLSRNNTDLIESLARTQAARIVKTLKNSSGSKTNIIRDYGYFIPYLVGIEFTGLSPSVKRSNSLRAFTFVRNLKQRSWGRGRMKLSGDHGAANAYLLWTHFLLGQVFSNFGNRTTLVEKVKHKLAGWASKKYFAQIDKSLNAPNTPLTDIPPADMASPFNLRQRLQHLEKNLPDTLAVIPAEQRNYIYKCILFEIMMSFHILIGISFAKILDAIIENGETLYKFSDTLRESEDPDKILNAYMSKDSPTAELYRISRQAFPEHGIKMGDVIKFNIKDASKNLPEDTDKFLNFGPHEGCPYELSAKAERTYPNGEPTHKVLHPCFGQFWARTVLKEMFLQLTDKETGLKNLSLPKGKTKGFAFIPDHLMVSFMSEG